MTAKMIRAPFSPEQVEALNRWQACPDVPGFTCPRGHLLIAETAGWRCPRWWHRWHRQEWAHRFMAEPTFLHYRTETTP